VSLIALTNGRVAAGESKEEMLIHLEIKHHLESFARVTKMLARRLPQRG
jgi:hypothetical protein